MAENLEHELKEALTRLQELNPSCYLFFYARIDEKGNITYTERFRLDYKDLKQFYSDVLVELMQLERVASLYRSTLGFYPEEK